MPILQRSGPLVAGLLFVYLVAGCGSKAETVGSTAAAPVDEQLKELGNMIRYHQSEVGKPPSKVEDILALTPDPPQYIESIRAGSIVLTWRVGIKPGSSAVLAYEKDAPSQGGHVLLQDGTVKKMTADEFKAAPKAQ
jgi:hypothetical protein